MSLGAPRRALASELFEVLFALFALSSAVPLFVARYVPIQDLPQHAAAVRVLHDFHTPAFGFERFFELHLGSTQYLAVYALADLFAYFFDVVVATKLVLAAAVVALPYSLRALLAALDRPESYALLSLPLVYNTELVLGFLNFMLGVPLMFWGLALFLRYQAAPTRRRSIALGAVALCCFLAHVVPYALLLIGALILGVRRSPARAALPFLPSLALGAVWAALSPSGRALAALSSSASLFTAHEPFSVRLREISFWVNDVLWGNEDERTLAVFIVVLALTFVLGLARRSRPSNLLLRLAALVPLCWVAYFVLPASFEFIWPIHARFALLGVLFLIPVLPITPQRVRVALGAFALAMALFVNVSVARAFAASEKLEYAGLRALLQRIPYGSRTAGLVFDAGSRFVRFSPYLHAVAWVQAERGGAVMFTFADFPASPFRFRESNRPPRVPPRWEWLPARVDTERDLGFYDYVLTRSARWPVRGFTLVKSAGSWALWSR